MLHSCTVTSHDEKLDGKMCKHPAVNRQIKCALCRSYDSLLPEDLVRQCEDLKQAKTNIENLQKSDGKHHTNMSISGMEREINRGFEMLQHSVAEGRVQLGREKEARLFTSETTEKKCDSLHYNPENKLVNPKYDPSFSILIESDPNKIFEAASLSLEKKDTQETHATMIRVFLKARRVYPRLVSKIAFLLQAIFLKAEFNEQDCIFGIALFLDPLINDDYEKGLHFILSLDFLMYHNDILRDIALKASYLKLMTQEHRDLLTKVLISKMVTQEELQFLYS